MWVCQVRASERVEQGGLCGKIAWNRHLTLGRAFNHRCTAIGDRQPEGHTSDLARPTRLSEDGHTKQFVRSTYAVRLVTSFGSVFLTVPSAQADLCNACLSAMCRWIHVTMVLAPSLLPAPHAKLPYCPLHHFSHSAEVTLQSPFLRDALRLLFWHSRHPVPGRFLRIALVASGWHWDWTGRHGRTTRACSVFWFVSCLLFGMLFRCQDHGP